MHTRPPRMKTERSVTPAVRGVERHTCDTLHAHTQVLGKLAVALAPHRSHSPNTGRCGSPPRGWETLPLPAPDDSGSADLALDLHHITRSPSTATVGPIASRSARIGPSPTSPVNC